LQRVWLTESVLCSAETEGGFVSVSAARACGHSYLLAQLALFPKALVVALGSKADQRLRSLGVTDFLRAFAAAPPGCNRREALASWECISNELHKLHRGVV
jgi:hypothetical protein